MPRLALRISSGMSDSTGLNVCRLRCVRLLTSDTVLSARREAKYVERRPELALLANTPEGKQNSAVAKLSIVPASAARIKFVSWDSPSHGNITNFSANARTA